MSTDSITHKVNYLLGKSLERWWSLEPKPPQFERPYSKREQKANERRLQHALDVLSSETSPLPRSEIDRQVREQRITEAWAGFAKAALRIKDRHVEALRTYGFADAAVAFARMARRFDPGVTEDDIFQASRNLWSMNLIQLLLGLPVEITPAAFAYSMLYPYTDNYLDDPAIPGWVKKGFNHNFYRRLTGDQVQPANDQEALIFDLVGMIEEQFDRGQYPQVYASLSAIHESQIRSLQLLDPQASPFEIDILGICFAKGGASVLADGYLVAGDLTPQQQEFVYYYGTFTQLVDDLEDIEGDLKSGLMTVFSLTARHWPLDQLTNKTFQYGFNFLECLEQFQSENLAPLKEMIRLSVVPLLSFLAGSVPRYYSRSYLRVIQEHFPLRFSYLNKLRKKLARQGFSPLGLVEVLAQKE
ncbi:MAG TPA: hypothetical protein VE136_03260 [Anaerolineales bacterium]|jgi:hypothetical protein|nr:hypothetical protein [Anaerolineales bacterium]